MNIGCIVPSRLQVNPESPARNLFLDRAIGSVRRQIGMKDHRLDIVVGLDPGANLPERFLLAGVRQATGTGGQASAVNAAAAALLANGCDVMLCCEDDDTHHESKLDCQLAALDRGYGFASASQREVTVDGSYVRVNDFAGPSSWCFPAELWNRVGPMDEAFKWHLDNDWLGRLQKTGAKRLHFAEHAAMTTEANPIADGIRITTQVVRPWLQTVSQFSHIAVTEGLLEPLVTRTVNDKGGMSRIARDPEARAESQREHMMLWERYGARIPW